MSRHGELLLAPYHGEPAIFFRSSRVHSTGSRRGYVACGAADYETAVARQLIVVEKRPLDPVAHFNAGCFAARAGRADEAIEHLRRAVEINGRIRELMATDEDLDSIREDHRFTELTR